MRSAYDFKCGVYIFGHIDTKFINGEMSRSDYVAYCWDVSAYSQLPGAAFSQTPKVHVPVCRSARWPSTARSSVGATFRTKPWFFMDSLICRRKTIKKKKKSISIKVLSTNRAMSPFYSSFFQRERPNYSLAIQHLLTLKINSWFPLHGE